MADFFQEVNEEVRRERMLQLWKRYGPLIVAAAFLLVAAIGAWRGYQWWEGKKAAESGAAFEAASALAQAGKSAEAEQAFARLATEGAAGYRRLARFREAGQLAQRDPKQAVDAYDGLAADASLGRVWQDLAAVRAGWILLDGAPYGELKSRLEPLTAADRAFRHTAREILALAAWRAGDGAATRQWIDAVVNDGETPAGVGDIVKRLMALTNDAKG